MINFLKKALCSFRLDAECSCDRLKTRPAPDEADLQGWAREIESLGTELRSAAPVAEAPAGLRASIMRSIRAGDDARETHRAGRNWSWVPVTAGAAALLVAGLILSRDPAPNALTPTAADLAAAPSMTTDLSNLGRNTATGLAAPLATELKSLGQDLTQLRDFLVASIP